MATLVFSAIGTMIGGPIGGAIGTFVGSQIDGAIFGGARREGPRLKELSVTTSSYGTAIPRHFGTMRVPGSIIWATDLVEHREKKGGGKKRPSVTTYTYSASFAVALASRPISVFIPASTTSCPTRSSPRLRERVVAQPFAARPMPCSKTCSLAISATASPR
jgi:hypothetical protein